MQKNVSPAVEKLWADFINFVSVTMCVGCMGKEQEVYENVDQVYCIKIGHLAN